MTLDSDKKRRRLRRRRLFARPQGRGEPHYTGLGNVVAERSEHHVVGGFRSDSDGGIAIVSGPSVLGEIGILHARFDATLWTSLELVPETKSAFLDEADIPSAIGTSRRVKVVRWNAFRGAAGVVGLVVAVATDLIQLEGGGGGGWNRCRRGGRWNRSGLGDGYSVVALIAWPPSVFPAVVSEDIDLRGRVKL